MSRSGRVRSNFKFAKCYDQKDVYQMQFVLRNYMVPLVTMRRIEHDKNAFDFFLRYHIGWYDPYTQQNENAICIFF